MNNIFRSIAKYFNIFPCPLCRSGDGNGRNELCAKCLSELDMIPLKNHCRGCGGVLDGALAICSKCQREKKRPWVDAISLFHYRDTGMELILKFKSGKTPEIARTLGEMGADAIRKAGFPIEIVTAIPQSFKSRWKRPYNQSLLVAKILAAQLGIPVIHALDCRFSRRKQATLNRRERLKNSGNSFIAVNHKLFAGKRILIVDDVFTTGSTCAAAAKALLSAGSGEVYIFTCARTPGAMD